MAPQPKAIGVLGGSFDPVHRGHIAIAESFVGSDLIEILFVVPTPDPPHKKDVQLTDFQHRCEMLYRAFDGQDGVEITTIEQDLTRPSYTVNTLLYIDKQLPETDIYLCMGEDSLAEFTQWYKWEEILNICELLVARRPDIDSDNMELPFRDKIHYVDHKPLEVSSSDIRKKVKNGEFPGYALPETVADYIRKHQLYK